MIRSRQSRGYSRQDYQNFLKFGRFAVEKKIRLGSIDLNEVKSWLRLGDAQVTEKLTGPKYDRLEAFDRRTAGAPATRSLGIYHIDKLPVFQAAAAKINILVEFGPPNSYFDPKTHFDLRSAAPTLDPFWTEVRRLEAEAAEPSEGSAPGKAAIQNVILCDPK
jgi:hypothetical protein